MVAAVPREPSRVESGAWAVCGLAEGASETETENRVTEKRKRAREREHPPSEEDHDV